MRLLSIVLYNRAGEMRVVPFHPGLNIVTGSSATGKSALLEIVEYCLGRDTLTTPVGPIRDSVDWYGLLVELPNQRAFVGRPAPAAGRASTQRAMLEFGVGIEAPAHSELVANADTATVRDELGRAIGIDENVIDASGLESAFEANLGHAALFCLQRQSEIANRELLFHRQGEESGRIASAIERVLPYFLGAVAPDRAVLRQQLAQARRDLRGADADLRGAEAADGNVTVALQAFLTEAQGANLLSGETPVGTTAGLEALRAAVSTPVSVVANDDETAANRVELARRRDDLRRRLYQIGQERSVLDALETDEEQYEGVVAQQMSRLRSLELIGDDQGASTDCPICGSELAEPDPTVAELRSAAQELQARAGDFAVARPRRRQALAEVNQSAEQVRQEIRVLDEALAAGVTAQREATTGRAFSERQAFLQGRIQHYLETITLTAPGELARLRERVAARQARVQHLEAQLDEDDDREQLLSRLVAIGRDMTAWAERLALEHSGTGVRLDARRLTVVTDTATGPVTLRNIGSAANWIGYHVVAHLALHKFFIEQNRPVPHFLMLDQPTQAYYPSDMSKESGVATTDEDRAAVRNLFRLLFDVAQSLEDRLQIIVCDHANLTDSWFQDGLVDNWRDGSRLIPDDWLDGSE